MPGGNFTGSMKRLLLGILLVTLGLTGCGYNPDSPVYDTAGNPDGFPAPAVKLIEAIQTGQLSSFESLVGAFGDLYTASPELLDDYRWRKVIERLGVQFRLKADKGAETGISGYRLAAQFYDLASLARPKDERLTARKELFAGWLQAIADSIIPADFDPARNPVSAATELTLLKYFLLGDSLHQRFAEQLLLPELTVAGALNKPGIEAGMPVADRCFLKLLGLNQEMPRGKVGSFAEPTIDLVAAQVTHQAGDWYAAELYFLPHQKLTADYAVAFRMTARDLVAPAFPAPAGHDLAFDFHPVQPTSHWKSGELAGVYRRFRYTGAPVELAVGLYEKVADSAHYLRVGETGERLLVLPASTFVTK
jgi:hypothetical protein